MLFKDIILNSMTQTREAWQPFMQALFYLQISEVETQSYQANFFFAYICKQNNIMSALQKSFLLTICSVNVAKSVGKCRFGHIY